VHKADVLQILFAASVAIAALTLAGAWLGRISQRVIQLVVLVLGAAAVAAWVIFGLDPQRDFAVPALGLSVSTLAALAALGVRRAVAYSRSVDADIARGEARVASVLSRGAEERSAELERALARARAESLSLIAAEERRIAESGRGATAESEQASGSELRDSLAETQRRVEERLAAWGEDLERAQSNLLDQFQQLVGRQRRLIQEAEERLAADAERLESESEGQRDALVKLREEVARATEQSIANAHAELDTHSLERRQALNDLSEQLRRRERELRDSIEREQSEALQSIQGTFSDVERRLVERLERVVDRTTAQHVDAAALLFADAIKQSREDSARRLARELERAVESFVHQAETLISERLANVGQAATQQLDRRLASAEAAIATRRDEVVETFEQRLGAAEHELRQRLDDLAADSAAERDVLEARLFELQRRLDAALAHSQALRS
jgi:hypothetical protein